MTGPVPVMGAIADVDGAGVTGGCVVMRSRSVGVTGVCHPVIVAGDVTGVTGGCNPVTLDVDLAGVTGGCHPVTLDVGVAGVSKPVDVAGTVPPDGVGVTAGGVTAGGVTAAGATVAGAGAVPGNVFRK